MDSYYLFIAVDNHASTCMTKNVNHFILPHRPINNRVVKGYGGLVKVRGDETVKCKIEDDDGKIHSIIIHNVNYLPESLICILLPQQWSQQAADNHPKPDGTWCTTKANHFTLYWDQ